MSAPEADRRGSAWLMAHTYQEGPGPSWQEPGDQQLPLLDLSPWGLRAFLVGRNLSYMSVSVCHVWLAEVSKRQGDLG